LDFGAGIAEKPYIGGNQFDSKEEAISKCFLFGKKIIDGEFEDLTPPRKRSLDILEQQKFYTQGDTSTGPPDREFQSEE
jgi:hypothetical protein